MFLNQLFLDLESLNLDYEKTKNAKTFKGVYSNILGYIFSVYCIFKVFMSILNLILDPATGQDPTTRVLFLLVHRLQYDLDIEFWTANLSFTLVGLMAIFAVRGFIIQISRVSDSASFNSDLPVLFMTQLMGFYLQSVMLMLRLSLPKQYRYSITNKV
jgi:golgi pH regulator